MIFRKPYAFLIKYFKLINLLLSVSAIFLFYKTYNIINFFNEYILNDYTGNFYEGFYSSYINPFIYLIIIIILICLGGIFLLFKYKKKPAKSYIVGITYYIIYIIFLSFIKNVMITLETSVITAETARLYRDISIILIIPQIPFIIMYLLRMFGFNTKKLNFEQDLKELEIDEKDSEEFEFTIKQDGVKLKRNIHRFFREFKYYVKENKFVFSIISIVLFIGIGFLIYSMFPEIVDRNYNQGDTFKINNIRYKIEDSILTNLDYQGNFIDNKKYYLVVKMFIENESLDEVNIDYNNFRLIINDDYIYPIKDKGKHFIDYANAYYSESIKASTSGIYSFVYEINESDLRKNYKIKIYNGSTNINNLLVGKHDYINISPIVINKVNTVSVSNVNDIVNFSNSNLGNSTFSVSNIIVTDRYMYNYDHCIKDICNTYKDIVSIDYTLNERILIVFNYTFELDKVIPYYTYSSNINTFISNYMKVKYKIDNEYVYSNIKNVTPKKMNNQIVIETTNDIQNSSELYLVITIRNKEYMIKIK